MVAYTDNELYLMILVSVAIITVPGIIAFAGSWWASRREEKLARRERFLQQLHESEQSRKAA